MKDQKAKKKGTVEETYRVVLAVTILNKVLKNRSTYYLIKRIEEIGKMWGLKYYNICVMEYDLDGEETCLGAEEIRLTLAESSIRKADYISEVKAGMLGFNNGGMLEIFARPQ